MINEGENLDVVMNYVLSDVYKLFSEYINFEEAINIPSRAFVQEKK